MATKVKLIFDVLPEEKEQLEKVCDAMRITKVEFLRRAIPPDFKSTCVTCKAERSSNEILFDKIARQNYCSYCGWPIHEDHSGF